MLQAGENVSSNAVASAQIPESAIPYSKADLNGYAVQLEDEMAAQIPYVNAGVNFMDLLENPNRFPQLTEVYLDRMLKTPGGVDIHAAYYTPIIREINARDPRIQAIAQQAQQQQVQQQRAAQQQQQVNANGFASIQWEDGGMPLASGRMESSDFSHFMSGNPTVGWLAADQMSAAGAFAGKHLVSDF
jgi:hypothetical protein